MNREARIGNIKGSLNASDATSDDQSRWFLFMHAAILLGTTPESLASTVDYRVS
jgi:hypothetical protein